MIQTNQERERISKEIDNITIVLDEARVRSNIFNDTFVALEKYQEYLYKLMFIYDNKRLKTTMYSK